MVVQKSRIIEEDLEDISDRLKGICGELAGKTVLVSGGSGFLGKYLVWTLEYMNQNVLVQPCKIIAVDNYITGLKGTLESSENIKVIEHDIIQPMILEEPIDYILHAASIAAPLFYDKHKIETIDVGYMGTKNMLELAKEKNVKSFVFFSSSEVYGNPFPENIPTPETYLGNVSCTGARASYDEPKRIGETLCVTYQGLFNVPAKIIRPFNVYGPGMRLDDGRGAINFAVSAMKNGTIPVYGDGKNTRTWCYITDAIVGFYQILLSNHDGEPFNIGSDEHEIETKHLAEIIGGLVGDGSAKIEYVEGPNKAYSKKEDPNRRCPDLTKSKAMLGYENKVSLVAGLRRFISWIEGEMKKETEQTFQPVENKY